MFDRVLKRVRDLVRTRQYVMTLHAEEEMAADDLTVYDVESVILTGQIGGKLWYATSAASAARKSAMFLEVMARGRISSSSKTCRSSVALIAERAISPPRPCTKLNASSSTAGPWPKSAVSLWPRSLSGGSRRKVGDVGGSARAGAPAARGASTGGVPLLETSSAPRLTPSPSPVSVRCHCLEPGRPTLLLRSTGTQASNVPYRAGAPAWQAAGSARQRNTKILKT